MIASIASVYSGFTGPAVPVPKRASGKGPTTPMSCGSSGLLLQVAVSFDPFRTPSQAMYRLSDANSSGESVVNRSHHRHTRQHVRAFSTFVKLGELIVSQLNRSVVETSS